MTDNARTGARVAAVSTSAEPVPSRCWATAAEPWTGYDRAAAILLASDISSHEPDWTWWVDLSERLAILLDGVANT